MTRQLDTIPDTPPNDAETAQTTLGATQTTPHTPRRGVHKYTKSSVWDQLDNNALACIVIGGLFGLLMGKWLTWCFIVGQMKVGR